jgi:hypothetical protein
MLSTRLYNQVTGFLSTSIKPEVILRSPMSPTTGTNIAKFNDFANKSTEVDDRIEALGMNRRMPYSPEPR